jgi:hypothetical protein
LSIFNRTGHDASMFYRKYFAAHPNIGADEQVANQLSRILANIYFNYETIAKGHANPRVRASAPWGSLDPTFKKSKIFWLFYDTPFSSWSDQLQSFMVKKNNGDLDDKDYILLFYISLQSVEVQDGVEGLPLSMLYDMFMPLAEENLKKWKQTDEPLST